MFARAARGPRRAGPLPRRHRRPLAEERARRRAPPACRPRSSSTATPTGSPRSPDRSASRSTTSSARAPIPATARRSSGCGGPARRRGDLYRADYAGRVLRRLRGVLDAGRARRRPLPGARHARPRTVVEQNWFFRLSRYRERSSSSSVGRAGDHAGAVPRRGAGVPRRGLARHQRVAVGPPGARAGASRCPTIPTQVVYVWFDALDELHQRARLRRRGSAAYDEWWTGVRPPGPRRRQGDPALPRRLLAGVPAVGRRAAADARSTSTRT